MCGGGDAGGRGGGGAGDGGGRGDGGGNSSPGGGEGGGGGGSGGGGGGGLGERRSAVLGHAAPPCWVPGYASGIKYATPPKTCVCVVPPGATLWAWTSLVKSG